MAHRSTMLLALACCLGIGCAPPLRLETIEQFQAAQSAFDSAQTADDYRQAAALYEQIVDRGAVSSVVFFNLGNAYMRAGEAGKAVASYRRAQRFRPRDPFLAANLQAARAANATRPPTPVIEQFFFWQNATSLREKLWATTVAAALAIACGSAALYSSGRIWRRLAVGLLIVAAILAASVVYDGRRQGALRSGVVTLDGVVARKGDNESYDPAFNQPLTETSEFRLLERRGDWLLVQMGRDQRGWIPATAAKLF